MCFKQINDSTASQEAKINSHHQKLSLLCDEQTADNRPMRCLLTLIDVDSYFKTFMEIKVAHSLKLILYILVED